jgi:hypothetical protein
LGKVPHVTVSSVTVSSVTASSVTASSVTASSVTASSVTASSVNADRLFVHQLPLTKFVHCFAEELLAANAVCREWPGCVL